MIPYQTKIIKFPKNHYGDLKYNANFIFRKISSKTKRQPYLRSAYFQKQKIFFNYFWDHLFQKSPRERVERLKYFEAAIEVIEKSKNKPISQENPHKKSEILYRFAGLTKDKELFYVQIKENIKDQKKYFMSCFPEK